MGEKMRKEAKGKKGNPGWPGGLYYISIWFGRLAFLEDLCSSGRFVKICKDLEDLEDLDLVGSGLEVALGRLFGLEVRFWWAGLGFMGESWLEGRFPGGPG
jgi:hypothetical protein